MSIRLLAQLPVRRLAILLAIIAVPACRQAGAAAGPTPAPQAAAPTPLRLLDDDSARVAALRSGGVSVEGRHVVAWFPRDSVPVGHMRALVDSLDAAIPAMQRFIGGPYPWQRLGRERITYYFVPERFVPHTADSAVFIPLWRMTAGTAPHLHETVHVLVLPSTPYYPWELADSAEVARVRARLPLWLAEGYADYVAKALAEQLPFHEGDGLGTGSHAQVDSICAERLRGPRGAEVAPYVGAPGVLPSLFTTERGAVAPTFYACASSFTKFLAERTSPQFLASLFPDIIPGRAEARIHERTGRTVPELRAEWLGRIGAAGAVHPQGGRTVPTAEQQITAAVLPLPASMRAGAGVIGYGAGGRETTLRASTNGMVCMGDPPGDDRFDVRCYHESFFPYAGRVVAADRLRGPATDSARAAVREDLRTGRLACPEVITAGYRMLGPARAYDPAMGRVGPEIRSWQSVHFPRRTAEAVGFPTEREGTMPWVMASGLCWSHVMIVHDSASAAL
ncbi:MAG TPA: hypothetical protein VGR37_04725 [Longimicrobiaceae bacterium]|nr:hypothetical protein [Longimicrobiaceae bacterium]